jgi:triacylglycerol lipase
MNTHSLHWMARAIVLSTVASAAACVVASTDEPTRESVSSQSESALSTYDTYAQTQYPIVLCHGLLGFDKLGSLEYFFGIRTALEEGGAVVYEDDVPAVASPEVRGDALIRFLDARRQEAPFPTKFNLIGHSLGGLDARYVAAVRPDLVASVTTVGGPNRGSPLGTWIANNDLPRAVVDVVGFVVGDAMAFLTDTDPSLVSPEGALTGADEASVAEFNRKYPDGLAASPCDSLVAGDASVVPNGNIVNGIPYYSWGATTQKLRISIWSAFTHPVGFSMNEFFQTLSGLYDDKDNDGLMTACSSHLGLVIKDDYNLNHGTEVNQLAGVLPGYADDPTEIFRKHANLLKNAGL